MLNTLFNIFTLLLPPFFASTFAGMAIGDPDERHLYELIIIECLFAVMSALCLHALFEGTKALEDMSC